MGNMISDLIHDKNKRALLVLIVLILPLAVLAFALISQTQLLDVDAALAGDPSVATKVIKAPGYSDVANEDSNGLKISTDSFFRSWVGTGQTPSKSYLGIRFVGESIPANATIVSARVELTSYQDAWIRVYSEIFAEKNANPESYSSTAKISARPRTTSKSILSNDVKWSAGQTYIVDVTNPIKEVFDAYKSTAKIGLIFDGTKGSPWGRKNFYSNVAHSAGPRLVITYKLAGDPVPVPPPSSTTTSSSSSSTTTTTVSTTSSSSSSTATSTTTTTTQTPPPPPPPPAAGARFSKAYDLWNPDPRWDTCSKEVHNKYVVTGPDGKIYPTWHPPVDPATGCTFGHEHGRDPKLADIWPKIQEFYAYDANGNGTIEASEKATAGVPFAYVNEQLDEYAAANGLQYTRHEDHVGHKVDWENDLRFTVDPAPNTQKVETGVNCDYFVKVHQGVHSKDAFNNNLHEVLYAASCNDGQEIRLSTMQKFGKVGQFTRLCDPIGDRKTVINTGFDNTNAAYPSGTGDRQLQDRDCTYNHFLVPTGKFSPNSYEAWPTDIALTKPGGQVLLSGINLLFDVLDPIRYFDPARQNRVAYFAELCYEVKPNGDRYRGGQCSGIPSGVQWDDPRSRFRGVHRGVYFKPGTIINNQGGSLYWFTDPFGGNATTSTAAGKIRQMVIQRNVDYAKQFNGNPVPEAIIRVHASQGVHAPN